VSHVPADLLPRKGITYRCHVCRIELVATDDGQHLTVAPFGEERPDKDRATTT
jgi:hypothetical protein